MRWDDLRNPAAVRDLLVAIFHPGATLPRISGALDGCRASGLTLAHCKRMGYAAPYLTKAGTCLCTLPRETLPQHMPHKLVEDVHRTTWSVCAYRVIDWQPGPSLPAPGRKHEPVYKAAAIVSWAETATRTAMERTDIVGAAARGFVDDDWTDVDASPDRGRWRAREVRHRRDRGEEPLDPEAELNVWRIEAQWRLFAALSKQAARDRPWAKEKGGDRDGGRGLRLPVSAEPLRGLPPAGADPEERSPETDLVPVLRSGDRASESPLRRSTDGRHHVRQDRPDRPAS